jgi:hypothetical protein
MALVAGKLLRLAFDHLGQTTYSTITSATASSIVDSAQAEAFADDIWEDGGIFIVKVAADAAPLNQFARISAYAGDTGTFTLQDALTADPPDGSEYAWASSLYPVKSMFRLVTPALRMIGPVPIDVDLSLVDGQVEYSIPSAYKNLSPIAVWSQLGETVWNDDVTPALIHDFHIRRTTPGAVGGLVIPGGLGSGVAKVSYIAAHAEINAYSDYISEYIDERLAMLALVATMLEWQIGRTQGAEEYVKDEHNKAIEQFREAMTLHAPDLPLDTPQLFITGGSGS